MTITDPIAPIKTRSFLDLQYYLALGGDLTYSELLLPNSRRDWPFRFIDPWDRQTCMGHTIMTVALALDIYIPRVDPFKESKRLDGPNFIPTTYVTEYDYWRLYLGCVQYFKNGTLP